MNVHLEKPAIWIDRNDTLEQALRAVGKAAIIAVDTESNSLYAYRERVCLIQFSVPSNDLLIDGLANLKLDKLGALFADASVEKVFHASEYDILCLKRDYGFSFNNIFDTMQAARILGYEKLGLSNLLEDLFGIELSKKYQKADWGKRPLSAEMLQYARMDTHHLIGLRDHLRQQLIEKELFELAEEDFRRLCRVEANHKDTPAYTQVSGYQRLDSQQLRVLDELCRFREKQAERMDRPLFKVIGNSALLAIAQACPRNAAQLKTVEELSPKLFDRFSQGLLAAVNSGLSLEPIVVKNRKRPSDAYINRLETLKEWRKNAAARMGVQSDIILPRDILEAIVGSNPQNQSDLRLEMAEVPWRYSRFGAEILEVIHQDESQ